MITVLGLLPALLAVATLLPLSRNPHWLFRGMEFPRLQLFSLGVLLCAAELAALELAAPTTWLLLLVTSGCTLYQAWWIAPYTAPWPNEVQDAPKVHSDRSLKILTSNVLQTNRAADKLLALASKHKPDVLVTLESDKWWQAHLDTLEAEMPYAIKCPLDNLYGMHVYSRLQLEECETLELVQADVPSMHCLLTLRSGDQVRMHFLHPAPPSPTENEASTERDAELVIVAKSVAQASNKQPIIVTGDLNDVAWSPTTRLFRKLSGLLDPRVGRGMFNTYHAKYPFMRWPLDHIFHSDDWTLARLERLPSIGSDHFPFLTELVHTPRAEASQDGLDADSKDRSMAESIRSAMQVSVADVPEPGA